MVGRFVEADAVCDVRVAVLVAELAAVTMVAVYTVRHMACVF